MAEVRNDLLEFLIGCSREGRRVVAYGAPGKGNTLLNHCGIRADLVEFAVDRNTFKHGKFLPGTHIPIQAGGGTGRGPVRTYVLIMPWNLRREISEQLAYVREWSAGSQWPCRGSRSGSRPEPDRETNDPLLGYMTQRSTAQ